MNIKKFFCDIKYKLFRISNRYLWYRFLSSYGTSYWRAASILSSLIIVVFPISFLLSGFQESASLSIPIPYVVEYNIWPDLSHTRVTFSRFVCDFIRSISYSLSILAFQRSAFYEPLGIWSQLLSSCATLAYYGQLSLLLLAIRRRFKR